MTLLSKLAILSAQDCKTESVDVPEWGGAVTIRSMTGAERDAFRAQIADAGDRNVGLFEAALLALTLVDDQGQRLFELDDVEALRAKSAAVLDRIARAAMKLNGMADESVEDAEKN